MNNLINKTIMRFTLMSACLDVQKLLYVTMLAFVMPIGMKVVSLMHNASDSQTFEMLSGKIGVAFVLMVLCLGLAGNSAASTGRGGEYLPLMLTRPITRTEYVITKWVTMTIIGGVIGASQNLILALIGLAAGEPITFSAISCMMAERILDAGLISAAMILTMLNRNPIFQIVAILGFYVWISGQTVQPVSIVAGGDSAVQELSVESTKILLYLSQHIADFILPTINVYDMLTARQFSFSPILGYAAALVVYLVASIHVINRREFFYGTN